jgi:hypothetical protein
MELSPLLRDCCKYVGSGEKIYVCEFKGKIVLRMGSEAVYLGQCFLMSAMECSAFIVKV